MVWSGWPVGLTRSSLGFDNAEQIPASMWASGNADKIVRLVLCLSAVHKGCGLPHLFRGSLNGLWTASTGSSCGAIPCLQNLRATVALKVVPEASVGAARDGGRRTRGFVRIHAVAQLQSGWRQRSLCNLVQQLFRLYACQATGEPSLGSAFLVEDWDLSAAASSDELVTAECLATLACCRVRPDLHQSSVPSERQH